MKILYISVVGEENTGSTSGVKAKCHAQVRAMENLGYEVTSLFMYTSNGNNEEVTLKKSNYYYSNGSKKLIRQKRFFDYCKLAYRKSDADYIYIRYPLASFPFLSLLHFIKKTNKSARIILERQAIEVDELRLQKGLTGLVKLFREKLIRSFVQKYIDINVSVTNEIAQYVSSYSSKKTIVMGNGININDYNALEPRLEDNSKLRFVFIGNITVWCGLDNFIQYLEDINFSFRSRKIVLEVIGDGVYLSDLKKVYGHIEQVRFHGFLDLKDIKDVLQRCDIGVGSLNPGIRGLKEGSNLKLRQYAAFGLPFVKCDLDLDFDGVKNVEGTFANINNDFHSALAFSSRVKGNIVISEKLRKYTNEHLSWETKLGIALESE